MQLNVILSQMSKSSTSNSKQNQTSWRESERIRNWLVLVQIYESWCELEIDHCVIVIFFMFSAFIWAQEIHNLVHLTLRKSHLKRANWTNKMMILWKTKRLTLTLGQELLLELKATLDTPMWITWAAGSALKILMRLKSTYNFVRGLGLKGGGWI